MAAAVPLVEAAPVAAAPADAPQPVSEYVNPVAADAAPAATTTVNDVAPHAAPVMSAPATAHPAEVPETMFTPAAPAPAAPAPVASPVAAAKPAAAVADLAEILGSAGLTLAATDPEKLRAAQEAAAKAAPPVRVPRERKPLPPQIDEPLVQIDTTRQ